MFKLINRYRLRTALERAEAAYEDYMRRPARAPWNVHTANVLSRAANRARARYAAALDV